MRFTCIWTNWEVPSHLWRIFIETTTRVTTTFPSPSQGIYLILIYVYKLFYHYEQSLTFQEHFELDKYYVIDVDYKTRSDMSYREVADIVSKRDYSIMPIPRDEILWKDVWTI